jgi:hypothetical protein
VLIVQGELDTQVSRRTPTADALARQRRTRRRSRW